MTIHPASSKHDTEYAQRRGTGLFVALAVVSLLMTAMLPLVHRHSHSSEVVPGLSGSAVHSAHHSCSHSTQPGDPVASLDPDPGAAPGGRTSLPAESDHDDGDCPVCVLLLGHGRAGVVLSCVSTVPPLFTSGRMVRVESTRPSILGRLHSASPRAPPRPIA